MILRMGWDIAGRKDRDSRRKAEWSQVVGGDVTVAPFFFFF